MGDYTGTNMSEVGVVLHNGHGFPHLLGRLFVYSVVAHWLMESCFLALLACGIPRCRLFKVCEEGIVYSSSFFFNGQVGGPRWACVLRTRGAAHVVGPKQDGLWNTIGKSSCDLANKILSSLPSR